MEETDPSDDASQKLVIVWQDLRPSTKSSVCVCSGTAYYVRAFETDEELDAFLKTRRGSFFAVADASQTLKSKLPGPTVVDVEKRFVDPKAMFDELRPEECVELVDASWGEDEDVSASVPLPPVGVYYSCDEGKALFAEILDAKSTWDGSLKVPPGKMTVVFPKLSRFRSVMTKPKPVCALDSIQKMCDYVCDFVRVMTRLKEWMKAVPKDWPRVDCAGILAKYSEHVLDHAAKPKTKAGYAHLLERVVDPKNATQFIQVTTDEFVLYRDWCMWVDVTEKLRAGVDWRVLGRHDLAMFARDRTKATLTEDGSFELTRLRWFPHANDLSREPINFKSTRSARLVVITGPNEIGKTTAVSAIVTAVRMARVGIPVDAAVACVPARGEIKFLDDCHTHLKPVGEELFPSAGSEDVTFVVSHDARAMLTAIESKNKSEIVFYKMETRGTLQKGLWVYDANKKTRFQTMLPVDTQSSSEASSKGAC